MMRKIAMLSFALTGIAFSAFILAGCTTSAAASGLAEAPPSDTPPDKPYATTPIERVAAALYRGERAKSARAAADLAMAAHMLDALGAVPADDSAPKLADAWRADARALGHVDTRPPFRGRILGPAYRRADLAAGRAAVIEQSFLSGQRAEIAVVPSAGAHFTVSVTDPDGQDVCTRPVNAPRTVCRWQPAFTARYTIAIRNDGTNAGHYYLVTN